MNGCQALWDTVKLIFPQGVQKLAHLPFRVALKEVFHCISISNLPVQISDIEMFVFSVSIFSAAVSVSSCQPFFNFFLSNSLV